MDSGFAENPWRGLDRVAFCENAILLEVKDQSQGKAYTARSNDITMARSWRDEPSLRNFLNDVALVAAGPGGKDNVVAACLEWETTHELCLRVARNEGFDEKACDHLQHHLDGAIHCPARDNRVAARPTVGNTVEEFGMPQDTRLESIVSECQPRLRKHASRFLGQLRHAQCRAVGRCSPPRYQSCSRVAESQENVKLFGPYDAHTHASYMGHVTRQFEELRNLCHEAETNPTTVPPSMWCRISRVAYQCRGSGALRLYLKENLCLKAKVGVLDAHVDDIIERIGKLARFYRASKTLATFMAWLASEEISLTVRGVRAHKIAVEELKDRTVAGVVARGGTQLQPYPERQICSMIQRWPRYRVHAEVQLVIFYEEHFHLETVGSYIGGDKLCCYLCHEFLVRHGRFQGNGCHQSLYSLWMVPARVTFASRERASQFHQALEGICQSLENQAVGLRGRSRKRRLSATQNESFANLSRISLRTFIGASTPPRRQLTHDKEVIFESATPLPSHRESESVDDMMVPSPNQSRRAMSSPASVVASEAPAPGSPISSPQAKSVEDIPFTGFPDDGAQVVNVHPAIVNLMDAIATDIELKDRQRSVLRIVDRHDIHQKGFEATTAAGLNARDLHDW